jgi:glycosyltransferase involved in cell wall biosynthesis
VVDDGSTPTNASQNQQLANLYSASLIRIPENRGLPNAINVGVEYWLADSAITWISYFQDDVDIRPDIFDVLAKLQHPIDRPLLAGQEAPEHPIVKTAEIEGYTVLLKRSMPGQHAITGEPYCRFPPPIWAHPKPIKANPDKEPTKIGGLRPGRPIRSLNRAAMWFVYRDS